MRGPRLRVLIAAFDGLQPSQVNRDHTPTIHRLASEGVTFARHHAVFPTVTRVNAASMMTGRHPGGHGLLGNTLVVPEWDPHRAIPALYPELRVIATSIGRVLLVPTLGEMLRPHGLTFGTVVGGTSGNAMVQHPEASHVGGAVLHPDFTLPDDHHARMLDRFGAWPPKRSPESGRIRHAADVLLGYLVPEVNPDVALVWFPEPDTSQHAAGVGSPPALEALTVADAQLGRILGELSGRGVEPDVLVVSDHGYSTVARRIQLEEAVREAGFPSGAAPGGVTVAANGGAALFYVRDADPDVLERLAGWLVAQPWVGALVAGRPAGSALGLIPGHLIGLAGPRAADIVMSFRWDSASGANAFPGSADSAEGAPGLGTHGSGSPHELRCSLFACGPSFRRRVVSELPSGNVDIAPTVLRLLGIPTEGPLDGRPLLEALHAPAGIPAVVSERRHHEARCRLDGQTLVHRAVVERVGHAQYVASLSAEPS
jgi:predicted AlkP superfamily pyrophosphatase or phosphodiesterase